MGQIVVNVGSFDLTSHNGNTAYSSVRYFDIPANAGITGCVATFAQHVNTGSFQGKSFSLNGAQAHPNTPWPTSGISLNPALLSAGQNTFRAAVKSQAGLSARWAIGDIYLTIDYVDATPIPDPGGGGGTTDPGTISISKTSLTAGESLTVSVTGASGGVYRDVYIQKMPSEANILSIVQGHGSGAGSWEVTIPESWCATLSPDGPSFEVRIYMVAYIAGGTSVGNGAKMLTVNVPASAVPTIGAFTSTRDANGVDASITKYVQNYSKVSLAMGSVAGALGSSIQSYEITGAGFSAAASSAAFGPFAQTGDITFTAKVTDTRGRTAARTVTINVLPYTPVSGVNLLAYRSGGSMVADDEGAYATLRGRRVFSSLDGQNAAVIKGRVYEKDTTAPGWTNLTDDTLTLFGGGTLSQEKGYTAEISINDKITAVVYVFQIPTSIVGIHITPGATGGGFGMYGQPNRWDFHKPVYANDLILTSSPNPNLLHNWDFRNPVNQRGVSGTISTPGYFYDRWYLQSDPGTINIGVGYVVLGSGTTIWQVIEGVGLAGKTCTVSIAEPDGNIYAYTITLPVNDGYGVAASGRYTVLSYKRPDSIVIIITNNAGGVVWTTAIKLELGTVSTLHLDPPADYGVELAKCQRFYEQIGSGLYFLAYASGYVVASFMFKAEKRIATPTISLLTTGLTLTNALSNFPASPSTVVTFDATKSGLRQIVIGGFSGLTAGAIYYPSTVGDYIAVSADL